MCITLNKYHYLRRECWYFLPQYLQSCDHGDLWGVSSPLCRQCAPVPLQLCATQAYKPLKVLSRITSMISSHCLVPGGCHLPAKTSPGNGSRMPCPVSSNTHSRTSRCSSSSSLSPEMLRSLPPWSFKTRMLMQVNMLLVPSSCTLASLAKDTSHYPDHRKRLASDLGGISR